MSESPFDFTHDSWVKDCQFVGAGQQQYYDSGLIGLNAGGSLLGVGGNSWANFKDRLDDQCPASCFYTQRPIVREK